MTQKGSKPGYFWTIDPSGTCAKAIFSHLWQCYYAVGFQGNLCGCECPSQKRKIKFSYIWTIENIENFVKFVYRAIKCYKHFWDVEDGSVKMPEVWEDEGQYQISAGVDSPKSAPKTEFLVPKAKHITPFDFMPHKGWSTHDSLPAVGGTHPYPHFEGDFTDKNRASLHGWEKLQLRGAVQMPEQRFMLNHPMRWRRFQRPSLFLHHGFVRVSLLGVTFLSFCVKCVKTREWVYQEESCETS